MESIVPAERSFTLDLTPEKFRESLAFVKTIKGGKEISPEEVSDLTRVNEQELFPTLIINALEKPSPKALAVFREELSKRIEALRESDPVHFLYRATQRALAQLVKQKIFKRRELVELKRFAFGKAQLDSDRARLLIEREGDNTKDTPLRAVKTALVKVAENLALTREEHSLFKHSMNEVLNRSTTLPQ